MGTSSDARTAYGADADWERLAQYVLERRSALGLTQEEIAADGGPSTATQRLIEGALQRNYRPMSLYALDRALGWSTGSHRLVLTGAEPVVEVAVDELLRRRRGGGATTSTEVSDPPANVPVDEDEVLFRLPPELANRSPAERRRAKAIALGAVRAYLEQLDRDEDRE